MYVSVSFTIAIKCKIVKRGYKDDARGHVRDVTAESLWPRLLKVRSFRVSTTNKTNVDIKESGDLRKVRLLSCKKPCVSYENSEICVSL